MTDQNTEKVGQGVSHLPLLRLGWVFLKIGTTAFGGLGAALALIERELVDRRSVLTKEELTEALTFTKLLPGSTVVQVVSYLGYRLGGWTGSAFATAAFVLPAAVGMTLLAALYVAVNDLPGVAAALKGLAAAVVGLLVATTFRLGQANTKELLTLLIAGGAFASVFFGINAAVVVVVAGLLGVLVLSPPAARQEPKGEEGS
jgi:chromate transporter